MSQNRVTFIDSCRDCHLKGCRLHHLQSKDIPDNCDLLKESELFQMLNKNLYPSKKETQNV